MFAELLRALIYGIVEGIAEWLPVSSTGHLILLGELPALALGEGLVPSLRDEFLEMFDVVIQLGAILAVAVRFFDRLFPFLRIKNIRENRPACRAALLLWAKIAVASLPAAAVGTVIDSLLEKATGRDIDGWLYTPAVVAAALVIYGVLFIVIERIRRGKAPRVTDTGSITLREALTIGIFQALAIIPGTSRSGSTVLGACCLGVSRPVAAEFSFFMALPAMLGAGTLKCLGFVKYISASGDVLPAVSLAALAVAFITAFAVSLAVIGFLTDFVKKHSFSAFGVYRIILGIAVILYFGTRK